MKKQNDKILSKILYLAHVRTSVESCKNYLRTLFVSTSQTTRHQAQHLHNVIKKSTIANGIIRVESTQIKTRLNQRECRLFLYATATTLHLQTTTSDRSEISRVAMLQNMKRLPIEIIFSKKLHYSSRQDPVESTKSPNYVSSSPNQLKKAFRQ